ncbi:MAG: 50S ribosomal protein L4 [Bacteroidota bacterium]
MEVSIYTREGKDSGNKAELKDSVFGIEPNETVLYEDVRRHQANKRQGTAKTKERSEVRGGGRKAYRQKGTGMARRGSIRSPLLIGGGTVFGPKPHDYKVKMTKKMRQLARRSALSLKAADQKIVVTEDWTFRSPKTRKIVDILESLEIYGKKVLVVTDKTDTDVYLSARNIQGVQVVEAAKPTTYDIMNADVVLLQESALETLQGILEPKKDEAA